MVECFNRERSILRKPSRQLAIEQGSLSLGPLGGGSDKVPQPVFEVQEVHQLDYLELPARHCTAQCTFNRSAVQKSFAT